MPRTLLRMQRPWANTVNGPSPDRVSCKPAASIAATRVEKLTGLDCQFEHGGSSATVVVVSPVSCHRRPVPGQAPRSAPRPRISSSFRLLSPFDVPVSRAPSGTRSHHDPGCRRDTCRGRWHGRAEVVFHIGRIVKWTCWTTTIADDECGRFSGHPGLAAIERRWSLQTAQLSRPHSFVRLHPTVILIGTSGDCSSCCCDGKDVGGVGCCCHGENAIDSRRQGETGAEEINSAVNGFCLVRNCKSLRQVGPVDRYLQPTVKLFQVNL